MATLVQSGQVYSISSGQTDTGDNVQSGGTLDVLLGGTSIDATISAYAGRENVYGTDLSATVFGTQTICSGGVTSDAQIQGGAQLVSGGTAVSTTIVQYGYQYVEFGGVALDTTLSGGTEEVLSGGTASNTVLSSGGYLDATSGGTAISVTVDRGAVAYDYAGGTIDDATISGGTLWLYSGGGLGSDALTFAGTGGVLGVYDSVMPANVISGFASGDIIDLASVLLVAGGSVQLTADNLLQVTENGSAYDLQLDLSQDFSGAFFHLAPDATAGTEILLGRQLTVVSAGVTDSGTVLSGGDVQDVYGTAVSTTVASGAMLDIESGGVASAVLIASGGYRQVEIGGSASGTTISYGGVEVAFGNVASTTLYGRQNLFGTATATLLSGLYTAAQYVYSGGVASGTTGSGYQYVSSGGLASGTVLSGGFQEIYSGGLASGATIGSRATQYLMAGGTAIETVASGYESVYGSGATAISTTVVGSDGYLYVGYGGTADAATISDGAILYLDSGGSLGTDGVDFAGSGGLLQIGDTVMPSTVISGLAAGDVIDLVSVTLAPGGSLALTAGNVLQIVEGGVTYNLDLDPTQDFSGQLFHLTADGYSGTDILIGGQITVVSAGQTVSGGTISGPDVQDVYGTAIGIALDGIATQDVFSGGLASATTVSSGAYQQVESGGVASATIVTEFGNQAVFGSASADIVSGQQLIYGLVRSAALRGGTQTVYSGGVASGTTGSGYEMVSSGGTAETTSLGNYGDLDVGSGGVASGTLLGGRTELFVEAGGTASATVLRGSGDVAVDSGGTADGTTLSGGTLYLYSGGSLGSGAVTFAGPSATLAIYDTTLPQNVISGFAPTDLIDLASVGYSGATVELLAGNVLQVSAGGSTNDLQLDPNQDFSADSFVLSQDNAYTSGTDISLLIPITVSAGQTLSNTIIGLGEVEYVYGTAVSTTVTSGGKQIVESAGSASVTTLMSSGTQEVASSGIAISTTIANWPGSQTVDAGGSASATIVISGRQSVYGTAISTTLSASGDQEVYGAVTSTTLLQYTYQTIYAGGVASGTVLSDSWQYIDGGTAISNTFSSGFGYQYVYSGGTAEATTMISASQLVYSGGIVIDTVLRGRDIFNEHSEDIDSGGTASGTIVSSGGFAEIHSGGSAVGLTVSDGGVAVIDPGADASSTMVGIGGQLWLYANETPASLAVEVTNSGGTVEIGGRLTLSGDLLSIGAGTVLGNVAVAGGGAILGFGTISGAVVDDGTIEAKSGTLVATDDVTGYGGFVIDPNADLTLGAAASEEVTFSGNNAMLTLQDPAGFTGTISGFAVGDTIDLVNIIATSATVSGSTLTVSESNGQTLSYHLGTSPTGDTVVLASDGVGGTFLQLSITVPYSDFLNAADTLASDAADETSAGNVTADALTVYTAAIAGAIGSVGSVNWESSYQLSSQAAATVASDLKNSASSGQLLTDTLALYGSIVTGTVGSIALNDAPRAASAVSQSAATLASDIAVGAAASQLQTDLGNLYDAIAGGNVGETSWQDAISASDQAAQTLATDIASGASATQIQGDVASLYDGIISGSLNAIGGSTLQQAYTGGADTILTLKDDILAGASGIQLQQDVAGLYNTVVSGSDGSASALEQQDYQSAVAAANALAGDIVAGANDVQLWYDTAGIASTVEGAIIGQGDSPISDQLYDNFANEMLVLEQQFSSGTPPVSATVSTTMAGIANLVEFGLGATAGAAFTSASDAAQTLNNDVVASASSQQILADELSLYGLSFAEYNVVNGGASSTGYSAITAAMQTLNADIESGNTGQLSADVDALIQSAAGADVSATSASYWQTVSNTVGEPVAAIIADISSGGGTSQLMTDAAALYDALINGEVGAIGASDELFAAYGMLPSTIASDTASAMTSGGDATLVLPDAIELSSELIDPGTPNNGCPGMEEEKTTIQQAVDFGVNVTVNADLLAQLLDKAGVKNAATVAPQLSKALESLAKQIENVAEKFVGNVTQEYESIAMQQFSYDVAQIAQNAASQLSGFLEGSGKFLDSMFEAGLVDLGAQMANQFLYNLTGLDEKQYDDLMSRQPFNFNVFSNTLHKELDIFNIFTWIQGKNPIQELGSYLGWEFGQPPGGGGHGDVHLTTFDGLHYDLQAAGEFVLTKSAIPGDTFQIQIRAEPFHNSSSVSVTTMVGAQVGSDRVTFGLNRDNVVWLNGAPSTLGPNNTILNLNAGQLIEVSPSQYQLTWNTGQKLTVSNNGDYLDTSVTLGLATIPGEVEGLLGPDQGQANDFQLADGTVLQQPLASSDLYGEFANAWRVTDATSLLDYGSGQNTSTFTNVNFPGDAVSLSDLPQNLVTSASSLAAAAGITDPTVAGDAELDYIATGDSGFINSDLGEQQSATLANATITVIAPPPPALGVSAEVGSLVATSNAVTPVTFDVYLTSASSTDTAVDYTVLAPSGGYFDASSFGGTLPSGALTLSAGQTSGQFTIDLPANALGTDPEDKLEVEIDAPSGNPVFATTAQTEVINSQSEPGNAAKPIIEDVTSHIGFTTSVSGYVLGLGAVPYGLTPTIDFVVENAAMVPADVLTGNLNVTEGSGFSLTGMGAISAVLPQQSHGFSATLDTGALGSGSETLTVAPVDSNDSGYSAALPNLTLTIDYSVLGSANAVVNTPTTIQFGNVRLDAVKSQAVSVTNTAPAGSAYLDANTSLNGGATGGGLLSILAPGQTDDSSLTVGLDTGVGGPASGIETITFSSDANDGQTLFLMSQPIEVFGSVFREADPSVNPVIVHPGDPTTQTLAIRNTAASDGYSEDLTGSIDATTGSLTTSGTIGEIAPQTTGTGITLTFATDTAASIGTVELGLVSDGTGIDGLGTMALYEQTVDVLVDNYAQAAFEELSGGGSFGRNGSDYTLDLGTFQQGSGFATVSLGVRNTAVGPADWLDGTLTVSGDSAFTNSGLDAFSYLDAGQTDTSPFVSLDTSSAGSFSETITLDPTGANASGYSSALSPETVTITGSVEALCFCRGTRILTDRDEVPVEELVVGDKVKTLSGAFKPIVWIGLGRDLVTRANKLARPIVVRRGALTDNVPHRDLYLTHGHAAHFESEDGSVLIPVEHLVNHTSIAWDETARVVEYFHIELRDHDVIFAEGAACETYYEARNRALFHNTREGSHAAGEKPTFAPVLHDGELIGQIWQMLFERAGGRCLGDTTDDPDVHLVVDGARIEPEHVAAGVYTFSLKLPPSTPLLLRSRSAVPSLLGRSRHEHRRLGVAIRQLILYAAGVITCFEHDAPLLRAAGCHIPEDGFCWTDGELVLAPEMFVHLHGGFTLMVHTKRQEMLYPVQAERDDRAA